MNVDGVAQDRSLVRLVRPNPALSIVPGPDLNMGFGLEPIYKGSLNPIEL